MFALFHLNCRTRMCHNPKFHVIWIPNYFLINICNKFTHSLWGNKDILCFASPLGFPCNKVLAGFGNAMRRSSRGPGARSRAVLLATAAVLGPTFAIPPAATSKLGPFFWLKKKSPGKLPSLKLTANSPLKIGENPWKSRTFYYWKPPLK